MKGGLDQNWSSSSDKEKFFTLKNLHHGRSFAPPFVPPEGQCLQERDSETSWGHGGLIPSFTGLAFRWTQNPGGVGIFQRPRIRPKNFKVV